MSYLDEGVCFLFSFHPYSLVSFIKFYEFNPTNGQVVWSHSASLGCGVTMNSAVYDDGQGIGIRGHSLCCMTR